jgi:hypothetical protein
MATFVNPSSGISQVASNVAVAYFVKDCTDKYYNVIVNLGSKTSPTADDFVQLKQAYDFFAAMRSGGTFPVPAGITPPAGMTTINFGAVYASSKDKTAASDIADKVDTLLKSFDNITIPSPAGGSMPVCVADSDADNANPGRHVTLYDLITNPNLQCVGECYTDGTLQSVPYDTGDNDIGGQSNDGSSTGWAYSVSQNGITTHVHDHSYSHTICVDVTGKASDFESIASVGSTNPQATQAAETALDNSILKDL